MKTLKVLLQEVVSGIKAWVNSNFAQESNAVHKTGNETITGNKTFSNRIITTTPIQRKVTGITDKNAPSSDVYTDDFVVCGNDEAYWGGLKHSWGANGDSATILAVTNWTEVNNTWSQGYWECRFSASKDFSTVSFYPSSNNCINLGSSSYQWNNVYAKQYYLNGTAFTDKFVTTDSVQTISAEKKFTAGLSLKNTAVTSHTTAPSSEATAHFLFLDGNDRYWGSYGFYWLTDGTTETRLQHTNYSTSGHQGWWQLAFGATKDFNNVYFRPLSNAAINLGDSTYKWKTLNGINPGALSLPNLTKDTYDPTNGWYGLDTTDWDLTGSPIDISSSILKDGYVYVCLACDSTGYVVICEGVFTYPNCYFSTSGLPVSGYARALLPVRKGTDVRLYLKGTSVYSARLFPALGNV